MDTDFSNRMDTVVAQLTTGFETNSEKNATMTSYLNDQLKSIGDCFGPDSEIFKQLIENKEACGSLHGRVESIGPNISTLHEAIQGLGEKELRCCVEVEVVFCGRRHPARRHMMHMSWHLHAYKRRSQAFSDFVHEDDWKCREGQIVPVC